MWCAVCYGCGAWQEIFILMRILPAKGEVRREMRNTEKYWLPGWCRWMRQGSCRDNTNYVLLTRETLDAMSIQYQYTSGREGDDSVSKVMICCCYWFVQTAPQLNTDLHTLLAGCVTNWAQNASKDYLTTQTEQTIKQFSLSFGDILFWIADG